MPRFRTSCAVLATAAFIAAVPPAHAQDDEVFINPDSPSGVEYDLPLERARRDADPARAPGAPVTRQRRSSPPFGEGIEAPAGAPAADDDGDAGGGSAAQAAGGAEDRSSRPGSKLPPEVAAAAARPVPAAGDSDPALLYGGAGLAVVAAGALLGLAVRRRRA